MEFDKSKVYTALNADEVKIGSKGYFADDLETLKCIVEQGDSEDDGEIDGIQPTCYRSRFRIKNDTIYNLFYLVEEPKEKKLRPYKDMDEMIAHFCSHFNLMPLEHRLPLLWLKDNKENRLLVHTIYGNGELLAGDKELSLNDMYKDYTYLDGSPCGIEE